ncbi:uncharacterized protein LOC143793085 [Ranitomeya variabilis]|uniref:uncharacterized protein LOC143793085 n=1 Tax=Ranitomeya variabilis TaxID=490064 RepID=UPI004055C476
MMSSFSLHISGSSAGTYRAPVQTSPEKDGTGIADMYESESRSPLHIRPMLAGTTNMNSIDQHNNVYGASRLSPCRSPLRFIVKCNLWRKLQLQASPEICSW